MKNIVSPEVELTYDLHIEDMISLEYKYQLEDWTRLKCSDILFDSYIDDWNYYSTTLNERIIGKNQLVFLIEEDDDEIFGYYLNSKVIESYDEEMETDLESFHFNLQSNGRLQGPMMFEIQDTRDGYELFIGDKPNLISLGDIRLYKYSGIGSYCVQNDWKFDYCGIENALCGKTIGFKLNFVPKRIIVIQMR